VAGGGRPGQHRIAGCRRLVKLYKGTGEASAAHQLMEKHGVKTGGGEFGNAE